MLLILVLVAFMRVFYDWGLLGLACRIIWFRFVDQLPTKKGYALDSPYKRALA